MRQGRSFIIAAWLVSLRLSMDRRVKPGGDERTGRRATNNKWRPRHARMA
jgi:hypothetical protein